MGDFDYTGVYKGMPLGLQTDKSFVLPGGRSISYIGHERLLNLAAGREAFGELILDGGELELKPERRFDAAVQAHMVNKG